MALCAQTNRTDWTRRAPLTLPAVTPSALPMQREDQREQAPGGVVIDQNLAAEPLHQKLGGLVVQPAPAHVDGFDLRGHRGADRLEIAVAQEFVVADHAPERTEGEEMGYHRRAVRRPDLEAELLFDKPKMQRVRPLVLVRDRERVGLQDVVDRDGALVLLIRVAAPDRRLVERHCDETIAGRARLVSDRLRHRSPRPHPRDERRLTMRRRRSSAKECPVSTGWRRPSPQAKAVSRWRAEPDAGRKGVRRRPSGAPRRAG